LVWDGFGRTKPAATRCRSVLLKWSRGGNKKKGFILLRGTGRLWKSQCTMVKEVGGTELRQEKRVDFTAKLGSPKKTDCPAKNQTEGVPDGEQRVWMTRHSQEEVVKTIIWSQSKGGGGGQGPGSERGIVGGCELTWEQKKKWQRSAKGRGK